jgi:hypothetical protein
MEKEQIFGKLSEFKGRSVTLFRSSDQRNTSIYFTTDDDKQNKNAYFEMLHFVYKYHSSELFIRFPNDDHFIELISVGQSSHNNLEERTLKNIWENKFTNFEMFEHDGDMFIKVGKYKDFNFLKIVGRFSNEEFRYDQSSYDQNFNLSEIENALKLDYLKLPMNVREISYMLKTNDFIPTYYIVDYPKYDFRRDNQRLRVIENNNIKEYKINSFQRYRDGGTTYIEFNDENDIEHVLFHPTNFNVKENVFDSIDEKQLIEVSKEEKIKICELLKLLLEEND